MSKQVIVRRLGYEWQAELVDRERQLQARALDRLCVKLRPLMDPDHTAVEFRTGDAQLDQLVCDLQAARLRAQAAGAQVQALVRGVLIKCAGWPDRDVAVLVGRSHQRVWQLRQQAAATSPSFSPEPGGPTP